MAVLNDILEISFESKCTCYLSSIYRRDGEIVNRSQGSGFFWRHEKIPYLITNRHVVTGRNADNKRIGSFDPTDIQIHFWEKGERQQDGSTYHRMHAIEANLWKDANPVWLEHPLGATIDVVALSLNSPDPISVNCVNDKKQYENWKIEAGADCFIIGYPEKISGPEGTPIWKRASIASEPQLNYRDLPLFLCDSATRSGLSGGPVFGKAQGFFTAEGQSIDPYGADPQFFGYWCVFLGIYAGRDGAEKDGFQLGRVWKRSTLDELLIAQQLAANPHLEVS